MQTPTSRRIDVLFIELPPMPLTTRLSSRIRRRIVWLTALCATVGSAGCSTTQARPEWVRTLTFWEPREADPRFNGPTPSRRIEQLREQATQASSLSQAQQEALAAELAAAYENEADPLIRAELLRTIACCGSPRAAQTLDAGLRDAQTDVRVAACEAWCRHGGPQAVARLSEALRKDADLDVRLAALRSLGKIPGQDSIAAITPALEDPDPALQYRAVRSLRDITGKDFGDDVNAWREFVRGGAPKEISLVQRMKLDVF